MVDSLLDVSEVTWLPEAGAYKDHDSRFVGSPSIVKSGNRWLASHDYFFHTPVGQVSVFASDDDSGVDWTFAANLTGIYWAQLFAPDGDSGDIYLIGPAGDETGEGDLRIARCAAPCDGTSWEGPTTIFEGTPARMFHAAPTPVVPHAPSGQLLRAMEVHGTAVPEGDLGIVMLAAAAAAECRPLTNPGCWAVSDALQWDASFDLDLNVVMRPSPEDPDTEISPELRHESNDAARAGQQGLRGFSNENESKRVNMNVSVIVNMSTGKSKDGRASTRALGGETRQWEEANAIFDPISGNTSVLVRLDAPLSGCTNVTDCNRAALLRWETKNPARPSLSSSSGTDLPGQVSSSSSSSSPGMALDAGSLRFDRIVAMPTGCNKFVVRAEPSGAAQSNGTWLYALSNPVDADGIAAGTCSQRNTAVLSRSSDLVTWHVCRQVLYDDTGFSPSDSVAHTGLQYIDFRFDGDDILMAIRAGYRGSVSFHDANRLLVKRLTDYRSMCD